MVETTYSTQQVNLLLCMIENIEGPLNVNWEVVANKLNYAHAGSARNQWNKIRAKMKTENGDTKAATPKSPRKRDADAEDGEGGDAVSASPTKKAKKTPKSKAVEAEAEEYDEEVKHEPEDGGEARSKNVSTTDADTRILRHAVPGVGG